MLKKSEETMKKELDCIFCKIVRKEIPAEFVHEDEVFAVFKDIHPSAPVHLLIVPKEHLEIQGGDLERRADVLGRGFALSHRLAEEAGGLEGYKLVPHAGPRAGRGGG